MLLEGVLREDFHFTPYSTISYLLPGPKAGLIRSGKQLYMDFRDDSDSKSVSEAVANRCVAVLSILKFEGKTLSTLKKEKNAFESKPLWIALV